MIPVEPFIAPAVGSREYNAVKKANKEKPTVHRQGARDGHEYYRVGPYALEVFADADDQHFIDCSCLAGTPPTDPETELPTREASPCYHAAAVLIHIAEKHSEGAPSVVIPFEQRRENVSATPS